MGKQFFWNFVNSTDLHRINLLRVMRLKQPKFSCHRDFLRSFSLFLFFSLSPLFNRSGTRLAFSWPHSRFWGFIESSKHQDQFAFTILCLACTLITTTHCRLSLLRRLFDINANGKFSVVLNENTQMVCFESMWRDAKQNAINLFEMRRVTRKQWTLWIGTNSCNSEQDKREISHAYNMCATVCAKGTRNAKDGRGNLTNG